MGGGGGWALLLRFDCELRHGDLADSKVKVILFIVTTSSLSCLVRTNQMRSFMIKERASN